MNLLPNSTLFVKESRVYLGLRPKIEEAAEYFSACITQPVPPLETHSCPASRFLPLRPQHGNRVGVVISAVVLGGTLCFIFIYQALK